MAPACHRAFHGSHSGSRVLPFSVLDSRSWAENPEHFRELLVAMGPMGHWLAMGGVGVSLHLDLLALDGLSCRVESRLFWHRLTRLTGSPAVRSVGGASSF